MVPADSRRISRVLRYSGAVSLHSRVSRTGLSPSVACLSRQFRYPVMSIYDGPTTPCVAVTTTVWATARSLATTCAITFVFFSSGYLDVSVHRVGPALCAVTPSLAPGCPIRTSTGQWVCAPRRGFSQLVTSFFAAESLGILHVPFSPFLLSLYLPVSVSGPRAVAL